MKFMEKVRSLNVKKAGYVALAMRIVNIFLHLAVITNILPFTWLNGGRTENFEMARQISFTSIIIMLVYIVIILVASGIVPVKKSRLLGIVLSIILWLTLPFDIICMIQQFLGTTFEKCFTSIITIVIVFADFRIVIEKIEK